MQESSRYAVGLDIGSKNIRCVIGRTDETTGTPVIVGVGTVPSGGMRKGSIVTLSSPAQAVDEAIGEAERMSGYQTESASISINGSHIVSTKINGMIAVSSNNNEITVNDLQRIEEVAVLGKLPANRKVLEVIPHQYKVDGQSGVKDPVGMVGSRLELEASVVSVLTPHLNNLYKMAEMARVVPNLVTISGIASAKAVLSEQQYENGVLLLDLGAGTTNLAIYEEGDLRYTTVLPVGGNNITNDLAIGLRVDPEVAEIVKTQKASLIIEKQTSGFSVELNKKIYDFDSENVREIIEARLEEILDMVVLHIKKAGKFKKLPSGVVLTGGTAQLKGIDRFISNYLDMSVRIGSPDRYNSVENGIDKPEFATAVGLMLLDLTTSFNQKTQSFHKKETSWLKGLVNRFKV